MRKNPKENIKNMIFIKMSFKDIQAEMNYNSIRKGRQKAVPAWFGYSSKDWQVNHW